MAYTEWLRVRGTLKIVGIVLGVLFLLGVVARIATIGVERDATAWVLAQAKPHGGKITRSTLPNGTHRTVIDNPKERVHIVIDDLRNGNKHITVIDRSASQRFSHASDRPFAANSVSITQHSLPGSAGVATHINVENSVSFFNLLAFAGILALIVATILGTPFARENDGHLELAFTKPMSRLALGLRIIAIDLGGIVASLVLGIVFVLAVQTLFVSPHVDFDSDTLGAIALVVLAPCAWYAMLLCATASMQRGYGAVVGFAWPIALIVVGLSAITSHELLLVVVRDIANVLAYIDPISYMHPDVSLVRVGAGTTLRLHTLPQDLALLALAVIYGAAALLQWRRVEA